MENLYSLQTYIDKTVLLRSIDNRRSFRVDVTFAVRIVRYWLIENISSMPKVFRMKFIIRMKALSSLIKPYQSQIQSNSDDWEIKFKKFMFNWSGYNKYGLYTHDLLDDEEPVIREALRRQPKELLDGRNFRYSQKYVCLTLIVQLNYLTNSEAFRIFAKLCINPRLTTMEFLDACGHLNWTS